MIVDGRRNTDWSLDDKLRPEGLESGGVGPCKNSLKRDFGDSDDPVRALSATESDLSSEMAGRSGVCPRCGEATVPTGASEVLSAWPSLNANQRAAIFDIIDGVAGEAP